MGAWFLNSSVDRSTALASSYDPYLVAVSIAIACFSVYAGFSVAGRITAAERKPMRILWLICGAYTSGTGFWAMHFIGMWAFQLPVPVRYDLQLTLLSMIPALAYGVFVYYVILRGWHRIQHIVLGGIIIGSCIGGVHYIGMAAMRMNARMLFDPVIVVLSILVAVTLSMASLYIIFKIRSQGQPKGFNPSKIWASLFIGCAVSGIHYTGMAAANFFPEDGMAATGVSVSSVVGIGWIGLGSVLLISLTIILTMVDQRISDATRLEKISRSRLLQAIESVSDGFALYDTEDRLVACNTRFRQRMFPAKREIKYLDRLTFEEIIRGVADAGLIRDAENRIDSWVVERLN